MTNPFETFWEPEAIRRWRDTTEDQLGQQRSAFSQISSTLRTKVTRQSEILIPQISKTLRHPLGFPSALKVVWKTAFSRKLSDSCSAGCCNSELGGRFTSGPGVGGERPSFDGGDPFDGAGLDGGVEGGPVTDSGLAELLGLSTGHCSDKVKSNESHTGNESRDGSPCECDVPYSGLVPPCDPDGDPGVGGALFDAIDVTGLDGMLFDATDVAGLARGDCANQWSGYSEPLGLGGVLVRSAAFVVDNCVQGSNHFRVCDCDAPVLSLATSAISTRTSCISRSATGAESAKLATQRIRRIREVVSYQRIFWGYATWKSTLLVE
ncbi:hypothetical protein V8E52_007027 [Russula decolorans]